MTSFKEDDNQHPEMNEDIEIDPKTPNSYKELLEMLQEEEGVKVSTGKEISSEVVE